jgi:hypothetical protein
MDLIHPDTQVVIENRVHSVKIVIGVSSMLTGQSSVEAKAIHRLSIFHSVTENWSSGISGRSCFEPIEEMLRKAILQGCVVVLASYISLPMT